MAPMDEQLTAEEEELALLVERLTGDDPTEAPATAAAVAERLGILLEGSETT